MLTTPVVLVVFNRPRVTRRNLAALRAVAPRQLLVVGDGPRADRPEDRALCDEVRSLVATEVDWGGTVETRFAERNLGLEANVELGLDWAFSQVDRAIVLEDDCIADPSFFAYAEQLLDRYAEDRRVWQIAGENHGVPEAMFADSYAFTSWASVWGWATWADRWHEHRATFDRDHAGAADQRVTVPARRSTTVTPDPEALVTEAARRHFSYVATCEDGDAYGWDHHWWVTIMARRGLCTTPSVSVVEHDGYGPDATHTFAAKQPTPAGALRMPLRHPAAVSLDQEVEREVELIFLRTDGRLSRLARRLIRPHWMRSLIRRIVTFPPVWRLVRNIAGR